MERKDLPDVLFNEMKRIFQCYPAGVEPVDAMLDQTGFFPGCKGLLLGGSSTEIPSILIVGHDFGTVDYYKKLVAGIILDRNGATFKKLESLLNDAKIDLSSCFFSNAIMGLRATPSMTGQNPGNSDVKFMKRNKNFLKFQIETIKPDLIITMGQYATKMLGEISPIDLYEWAKFNKWTDISKNGNLLYKTKVNIDNHICTCVAIEQSSYRHINALGKEYRVVNIHNDMDAEVRMLEDALANL